MSVPGLYHDRHPTRRPSRPPVCGPLHVAPHSPMTRADANAGDRPSAHGRSWRRPSALADRSASALGLTTAAGVSKACRSACSATADAAAAKRGSAHCDAFGACGRSGSSGAMALCECAASGIRPPRTPHVPPRCSSKGAVMAHAFVSQVPVGATSPCSDDGQLSLPHLPHAMPSSVYFPPARPNPRWLRTVVPCVRPGAGRASI